MTLKMSERRRTVLCAVMLVGVLVLGQACERRPPAPSTDAAGKERIEALYAKYKESFPETPEVTVAQLVQMRKDGAVTLVDGREERERQVSRIPGSVTLADLEADLGGYKGKDIVVYCTVGYRSGLAAKKLREKGLQAFNLKGGILSWAHAGQKLIDEHGKETKRVHVFGPEWDLAPEGYEAVW